MLQLAYKDIYPWFIQFYSKNYTKYMKYESIF